MGWTITRCWRPDMMGGYDANPQEENELLGVGVEVTDAQATARAVERSLLLASASGSEYSSVTT